MQAANSPSDLGDMAQYSIFLRANLFFLMSAESFRD